MIDCLLQTFEQHCEIEIQFPSFYQMELTNNQFSHYLMHNGDLAMKLTKETLKRIINEELEATLSEMQSFNIRGNSPNRSKRPHYDGEKDAEYIHPNAFAKVSGKQVAANIKNVNQIRQAIKEFSDKIEEAIKNPNWQGNVLIRSAFGGKDVFFHVNDARERREQLEMLFRESLVDNLPDDFQDPENGTGEGDVVDDSPLDPLI